MEANEIEKKMNTNGLETQVSAVVNRVKGLIVTNPETYTVVAEARKEINARLKFVADFFKPIKQDIDQVKKRVLERERLLTTPLEEAKRHADGLMIAWDNEQEKIRREQERKLQEEAQLAAATAAEEEGDNDTAEAILDGHIGIAPVILPKVTPQVQGVSYRENWAAEVFSVKQLARAVADGLAPESVLMPNMPALNAMARASKKDFNMPGVRAVMSKGVASRA